MSAEAEVARPPDDLNAGVTIRGNRKDTPLIAPAASSGIREMNHILELILELIRHTLILQAS